MFDSSFFFHLFPIMFRYIDVPLGISLAALLLALCYFLGGDSTRAKFAAAALAIEIVSAVRCAAVKKQWA